MKPQETITSNGEILKDFSLIPLPSSPHSSPRVSYHSTVGVGSDIYVIGGHYGVLTSSVRILDCRSHTWRDAPNMMVARGNPIAVYLDDKIYVMDGYENDKFPNWIEVFDIKTQTWRALPSPGADIELNDCFVVNPDALEGKIYVASYTKDYTYDPKCDTWKVVREKSSFQEIRDLCVIDNVMYSFCESRYIKWYDSEDKEWREIKGLEGLCLDMGLIMIIRIVNYGGKLVLMWKQYPDQHSENPKSQIRCARIALEKRHRDEIWGKTEWLNTVLEIPKSYHNWLTCVAVSI